MQVEVLHALEASLGDHNIRDLRVVGDRQRLRLLELSWLQTQRLQTLQVYSSLQSFIPTADVHMLDGRQTSRTELQRGQTQAALDAHRVLLAVHVRLLWQAGILLGDEHEVVGLVVQMDAVQVVCSSAIRRDTQQHEVLAALQRTLANLHALQTLVLYR